MSFFKKDPDGPPAYSADYKHPSAGGSFGAPAAVYATVVLSEMDKLRLINFPPGTEHLVKQAIVSAWPNIQREGPTEWGGYEFKLRGCPWYGQGAEAVPSRRLMIHLLHALSAAGWHLSASIDMTKRQFDKDTLFFRKGPPVKREFFSVSLHEYDKVRIIDANDRARQAFIAAVRTWPEGVQTEKEKEYGCYQIKLKGTPWATHKGAVAGAAAMLGCHLLSAFDSIGYELAGAIDMSGGSEDADVDSWFFASKV